MAQVPFPAVLDFSIHNSVQTDYEAHPTSYAMGTGGFFLGVKRQGREDDHSSPSNAEIKNGEANTPALVLK
jgi:hypothetical protein